MKNRIILYIIPVIAGLMAVNPARAERFELRPHATIGLGSAINMKSTLPMEYEKSHTNEFGLDFGYNFWQNGGNNLNVNIGLGYRPSSVKLKAMDLNYNYFAPAAADMDGDTYYRYYDVEGLEQKINIGYFNIPVYLGYGYTFNNWLGVYANLGVNFGFKCSAKIDKLSGSVDTYGIYPQYNDGLIIDDPYLNGFGENNLNGAEKGQVNANSFMPSLLVGAGLEAKICGPLWFTLGVRYDCGFNHIFKDTIEATDKFTAENAPVTYTVAAGEKGRSLTDYLSKSRLSAVSLNLGFSIKF